MNLMGKKQTVSIKDQSLVLHDFFGKKTVIPDVFSAGPKSDELFTPVGFLPEKVQKSAVKAFANEKWRTSGVGMLAVSAISLTAYSSSLENTLFFALSYAAATVLSLTTFASFDSKNTKYIKINEKVLNNNLGLLSSWIHARYGFGILYEETTAQQLKMAATKGLTEDVVFTGSNNQSYVLKSSNEGELYVEPVSQKILPNTAEVSALEAPKTVTASPQHDKLDSEVSELLNSIRNDVKVLDTHDVDVEQQHVLDRAVQEANRAVSVLLKIRTLDAEASNIETVDILSLVKAEISEVKKSVLDNLHMELKTVNSYRVRELSV